MKGFGNTEVMETFIDPHHHPEAAAELERMKLGLSDKASVSAAFLDPGPRERETEEEKIHARVGGPLPEEVISNEERTAQYSETEAEAYNRNVERRVQEERAALQRQDDNPDAGKDMGNQGDQADARSDAPRGEELSNRNPTKKVPREMDTQKRLKEIAEGAATAEPESDEPDED